MAWLDGFLWVYYMGCTIFFRSHPIEKLVGWDHPQRMGPVQNAGELSVSYTNVEPDFLSCPFQTGKYYIYIYYIDIYIYTLIYYKWLVNNGSTINIYKWLITHG